LEGGVKWNAGLWGSRIALISPGALAGMSPRDSPHERAMARLKKRHAITLIFIGFGFD